VKNMLADQNKMGPVPTPFPLVNGGMSRRKAGRVAHDSPSANSAWVWMALPRLPPLLAGANPFTGGYPRTRTDTSASVPRALFESGAGDWKARGIAKPEPIMRPRLYNIAHSSRFSQMALNRLKLSSTRYRGEVRRCHLGWTASARPHFSRPVSRRIGLRVTRWMLRWWRLRGVIED
jgi:hypothetical protein